jgi:hypothetical protein
MPEAEPSGVSTTRFKNKRLGWNGASAEVETEIPALLAYHESWLNGWTVEVDGKTSVPLRVNHIFQGVWLFPGKHTVRFIYSPSGLWFGLGVMGAALCVCGGLLCFTVWPKKQHPSRFVTRWTARGSKRFA